MRVVQLQAKLAEAHEELSRERRIGVALREVGLALGTTGLDLDQLLLLILQKINDAVEADRSTLYLLDERRSELVSRIVQGEEVRSIRLKVGQGIAGHVAHTSRALLVNDPYADPRFNPEWDKSSGYRTRSILAVPMKNHLGKTIGVVQVLNKKSGQFSDHDAVTLAALATQAAISIDNSRLFLSVTQKNTELLEIKEQLEHRVRDLKLLFDLESAMGRATSLEELFTGVLSEALRTSGAAYGAFAMRAIGADSAHLYLMRADDGKLTRHPLKPGQGLAGAAMADGGRGGVILNIASDLSVLSPDQRLYRRDGVADHLQTVKPVTYSVIKAGLVGLTRYLATYWAREGIRVNCLSPGGVFADHDAQFVRTLTDRIPLGRMAHPDEYKGTVLFLVSDASSFMTGANLIVDGGRTAW